MLLLLFVRPPGKGVHVESELMLLVLPLCALTRAGSREMAADTSTMSSY